MYYYNGGGSSCGCQNYGTPYMPYPQGNGCGCQGGTSSYAIVLVLFILLVIVIGSRFAR
ncbi:MAG: YjcZ family sporulation protein [Bacilli bacterium]